MKHCISIILLLFCLYGSNSAQTGALTVGDLERQYILHLPSGNSLQNDLPLVIVLHSLGATAASFEQTTQFSAKADQKGFIVVYPQGLSNSWNAGGCCDYAAENNIDDIGFISALIDTLIEEQAVDSNRVFIAGFSNGGIMAYTLASELSDKIAGIAPVGALFMREQNHASKPVPIIHLHARNDGSVDPDGQWGWPSVYETLDAWKVINGITAAPDTFRDDSGILGILYPSPDSTANIILYLTETGGHSYGLTGRLGTTNRIWEFFSTNMNKAPVIYDTIPEGGLKRDFKTYIPTDYFSAVDNERKYPLILAAHGWNQDAGMMEEFTGLSTLGNSKDFFTAYLHYVGPPPNLSWNYFMDEEKPDDIGYAKAVIDTLFSRYPIDSSSVFDVGFSDGCGLADRLPFETDGLVSAIGTVGGMIVFDEEVETTPVRMIHFHARSDPAVNYSTTRNSRLPYWLGVNESTYGPDTILNAQGYIGEVWKNAGGETMNIFYTLPWNRHEWPVENTNGMLLSASELIWNFFSTGMAIPDIAPEATRNDNVVPAYNFHVFPNPASEEMTLEISLTQEEPLFIHMIRPDGRMVYHAMKQTLPGSASVNIPVGDLSRGIYLLLVRGDSFQEALQVELR